MTCGPTEVLPVKLGVFWGFVVIGGLLIDTAVIVFLLDYLEITHVTHSN